MEILSVQGGQEQVNISLPQLWSARLSDVYSYYLEKKYKCNVHAPMKYVFSIAEVFHQLYFGIM